MLTISSESSNILATSLSVFPGITALIVLLVSIFSVLIANLYPSKATKFNLESLISNNIP